MSPVGYISIIRPVNAVASGIAAAIAYFIAGGIALPAMAILFGIVTLICAGGNALNDYFDAEIDKINRPGRPIPAGIVSPKGAFIYAFILFAAGFALSFFTNVQCIAIALVNILMLIVYSSNFKRIPVLGNVCVAYLAGSIFLFGGLLFGPDSLWITVPLFLITFFGTWSRELLKDAEDIEGDKKAHAKTLAMLLGVQRSGWVALMLMLLAVAASVLPYFQWGVPYLAAIVVVDIYLLLTARTALSCMSPDDLIRKKTTGYLKGGMFAAVLVFLVIAVIRVLPGLLAAV